jgi:hypothetical protein
MTIKIKSLPLLGMGLLASLSCTSSAVAADVTGYTSGTQKVISSIPLGNGLTAVRVLYLVGIVTDAQEGLFHGATQVRVMVSTPRATSGGSQFRWKATVRSNGRSLQVPANMKAW